MKQLLSKGKVKNEEYEANADQASKLLDKIVRNEMFNYNDSQAIFVYCPSADVDPSFVATVLGSYDPKVLINNHWAPLSRSSPLKVWYGALATYTCAKNATVALKGIHRKHGFLKILRFKEIKNILLKAELRYPKPSGETTKIVFRAPNIFPVEKFRLVKNMLDLFGIPRSSQLFQTKLHDGVILAAEYSTQFQAYVAKIAIQGSVYKKVGSLDIEIIVSEKGKEFDKFVRDELEKCIAEKY